MVKVRFPNGQCVQYNNVVNWELATNGVHLKNRDKNIEAYVPYASGAIIEWVTPRRIDNPVVGLTDDAALDLILKHGRELRTYDQREKLSRLKRLLSKFNMRYQRWGS